MCFSYSMFTDIYYLYEYIYIYIHTSHYITSYYTTLHYSTLNCTPLHYITLHYTTLHYITLHTYAPIYFYTYMYTLVFFNLSMGCNQENIRQRPAALHLQVPSPSRGSWVNICKIHIYIYIILYVGYAYM